MSQDIPGFGLIRSDNPIVAEVYTVLANDMYPEGTSEGNIPMEQDKAIARLEESEIITRLGGLGLLRDFADEMVNYTMQDPISLLLDGPATVASTFLIGIQVGSLLERRAANDPNVG